VTFRGLRAVVTGGGSGLGRALSLELARRGARVLVSDVAVESAERTAEEARALGAEAHAARCDVTSLPDVEALAKEADARLGGADFMANNAGVAAGGRVGELPIEDWRWVVDVNLWGVIYGCHVFAPRFRAQRSGYLLNVASAAGLLSAANMGAYNVTKAGVVALSETMYQELADDGVGVTVLCPTFFRTNIGRSSRGGDAQMKELVERLMDRASITAESVARAALDAVAARRLYALAGEDGRWMWRLKRAAPQAFYGRLGPALVKIAQKRLMK
jgi:NAD(P)-dependent dehydrogenase (short-subunit alcohol dehydrogenase family)